MQTRFTRTAVVVLAAFGSAASTAAPPLVDGAQLDAVGMYRYWQATLPLAAGDVVQEGYLVDGALYVITEGGTVFALTAREGLIRWAEKLAERDHHIYRPTHLRTAKGDGPVVIPTTAAIFLFNRFSGDLVQRFEPAFAPGSAVVGYDDRMFTGSANGRFYALLRDPSGSIAPLKAWEVLAGGPVTATPALYDQDTLLFASQSGAVFSCRASDKTLYWTFRASGAILGDPFVDAGGVYVASADRSLYRLDAPTGRLVWRFRFSRPLFEGPVVVAQAVFQYCLDYGLSAIDADSGRAMWRNADGRSFVAHTRNGDFILTGDERLLLVDHETGQVRHSIAVPDAAGAVRNTRGDAVYLLGRKGRVLCARLDDVPYLRRQQVMAARNRLHLPPSTGTRKASTAAIPTQTDPLANDPFRSRRDIKP